MKNPSILLVEDNRRLAGSVRRGLCEGGMTVDWRPTSEAAREALGRKTYALILLDIRLPGQDGLEFLRELRAEGDFTPVLVFTARDAIEDRVPGLDSGGDDYLTKPFAFVELLARVNALLRQRESSPVLQVADIRLDTVQRTSWRGGGNSIFRQESCSTC